MNRRAASMWALKPRFTALMSKLAAEGMAILMISSELPEVLGMSDRILVMREGQVTGLLTREEATQEKVLHLATQTIKTGGPMTEKATGRTARKLSLDFCPFPGNRPQPFHPRLSHGSYSARPGISDRQQPSVNFAEHFDPGHCRLGPNDGHPHKEYRSVGGFDGRLGSHDGFCLRQSEPQPCP